MSEVIQHSLFRRSQRADVTILTLATHLRLCRYQDKQTEYNQVMRKIGQVADPRVLFDFSECGMLDSVTVGILIGLTKAAISKGGQVGLCSISPGVRDTLSQLLLLEPDHRQLSWMVHTDIEEAVAQMSAVSAVATTSS